MRDKTEILKQLCCPSSLSRLFKSEALLLCSYFVRRASRNAVKNIPLSAMKQLLPLILLSFTLLAESEVRVTPIVKAVRKAMPWVVSIGTEIDVRVDDPYIVRLNNYFALRKYKSRIERQYTPLGSGVIIDSNGLALTSRFCRDFPQRKATFPLPLPRRSSRRSSPFSPSPSSSSSKGVGGASSKSIGDDGAEEDGW